MVKRKTDRGKVPLIVFQNAAMDIRDNQLSIRKCAEKYGIDRMTLKRYLEKVAERGEDNATMGYSSHRKVFTAKMESDLAQHLIGVCNRFYGLTPGKVRTLAWEYATKNNVEMPETWNAEKRSGKKWLSKFMNRHNLSLRVPEATSAARATAFNKTNVSFYFDNLYSLMEKHKFNPGQIYNMDETGCTTVQSPKKFLLVVVKSR